jgi:hypothetical protein
MESALGMPERFISSINADDFATLRPNDSGTHIAAKRWGMAEADGNRTRRMRLATHPIGFEVRGPHQRDNRFQNEV